MKAPLFRYTRPNTLEEALALLHDNRGGAQVLAGGQSLIPTLNMRLSAPDILVDINRIDALCEIGRTDDAIRLPALVRHYQVMESDEIKREVPLLSQAMQHVAHLAVRNRGTTCGSIAFADPSAEAPAVAVLLDATIHLRSRHRAREVSARTFFRGLYETDRGDDEMIVAVDFPRARANEMFRFAELSRRHGDFAVVGIAVKAQNSGGSIGEIDVVLFGSEPAPLLSEAAAQMKIEPDTPDAMLREMAGAIATEMDPIDNHQGRPDTKRRQARTLLHRAFANLQKAVHA